MNDERNTLCAELLSIENELEFRKEQNLNVDDLLKRKKEINQKLKQLKSKKHEDLDGHI